MITNLGSIVSFHVASKVVAYTLYLLRLVGYHIHFSTTQPYIDLSYDACFFSYVIMILYESNVFTSLMGFVHFVWFMICLFFWPRNSCHIKINGFNNFPMIGISFFSFYLGHVSIIRSVFPSSRISISNIYHP